MLSGREIASRELIASLRASGCVAAAPTIRHAIHGEPLAVHHLAAASHQTVHFQRTV